MRLNMAEKKSLSKIFADRYRYASKLEKIIIINEFIEYTKYNRNYAARVLRNAANPPPVVKLKKKKRNRKPYYDDIRDILKEIWRVMDYICGKRLVAILPQIISKIKQFNSYELTENNIHKLNSISAATIDRLLKSARRLLGRKGTSITKSTKYLVDKIPIKTFGEWQNTSIGYLQLDLLAHNGGDVYGGFLYTLNSTDIKTSWTICTLVQDKTMPQMLKSLSAMKKSFPFPIKGMHSDNGTEFINDSVLSFTKKHEIEFTRSRPYKKNDNPHVEQKNYSVLRRNTGYLRYDKPEHSDVLKELYKYLNLYVNYFQPTMILREKHRIGAKAIRKYDPAKTPYQRLLKSKEVTTLVKKRIKKIYDGLNPVEIKNKINECQSKLIRMAAPMRKPNKIVKIRRKKEIKHTKPKWRRNLTPDNPNPFLERQKFEEMKRAVEVLDKARDSYSKG